MVADHRDDGARLRVEQEDGCAADGAAGVHEDAVAAGVAADYPANTVGGVLAVARFFAA